VNIVTHGFNPTPPPIGTWEGFRRGWHVMAKKLNAIPTDGAALSGRVATYVAEWESSAGFWDGFVYLIAAKAAEAGAEEAELAGDHAKAAKFSQRAAAHKAAARKLASTSAQHASDAADKIVKDVTALGAGLLLPDPAQSRAAQQRVHLIAHSRGAAVNARVAKRLVKMGYYVDQYTALDGFSTDWPDDAGMIGDISIVDEAAVSDPAVGRKVSYRVGKDLGDYILDHIPPVGQPILNPFVQAIKLWLAFTAEKDLPDDLALLGDGAIQIILTFLDLRAPERVSFEAPNPILAGLAVDAPDCLGGIGQKIEGDKDGESSHVTATQMYACSDVLNVATKYIFDNFVGKYRDAKTLPPLPPLPAVLASALGPAAAAAADATDFRDGGFEQLGSLAGSIQRSDSAPTGVPIVDLAYEALSKPSGVLELLWEVSGDVRLIDEGGNTVVELRQTAGTALGQFVRVGNAASRLEFDLWVPQRGVDGKLQISFAGEVLETVALASAVDGHYSIPVGHIAGRTGQIEFVLMGFDTGSSVVRLDNLVILSAGVVHDLSVVKITASPTVTLTDRVPVRTERVAVRIQSQSSHDEVIPNLDTLNALVSLKVESLGPCASPVPTLVQGAPQVKLPFALKPKRMFNVVFDVEFGCSNDPARSSSRSPGHGDYRYRAIVDHAALNGESDDDPSDDVCPRTVAPPFRVDPNPDGKIRDRGCGSRKADGTLGGDVVIDVIDRR